MSPSALSETIALSRGKEKKNGQYTRVPVELEVEKRGQNTSTIRVRVKYQASQDRTIEVPLETDELRQLHQLTESLLDK